jgi:hypothetical protein
MLEEFFISHGSLGGLTTMGTIIEKARILSVIKGQTFYRAVSMELWVPVVTTKNRNLRNENP